MGGLNLGQAFPSGTEIRFRLGGAGVFVELVCGWGGFDGGGRGSDDSFGTRRAGTAPKVLFLISANQKCDTRFPSRALTSALRPLDEF